jgi:glycosidase
MCLPGVPSIYYADEAGSQGLKDPLTGGLIHGEGKMQIFLTYIQMC